MSTFDIDWTSSPCILVTGGSVSEMRAHIESKVTNCRYPVWEIGGQDTDDDICKTLENLADDTSVHKLLIFEGNTHKFARDEGNELSNYFWYPNFLQTRTILIVLVEDLSHKDFYAPLLTSKYHMDIRNGDKLALSK